METIQALQSSKKYLKLWLLPLLVFLFTILLYITWAFWSLHRYLLSPINKFYNQAMWEAMREHFLLDKPVFIQYFNFIYKYITFDLGPSAHYSDLTFRVQELVFNQLHHHWIFPALMFIFSLILVFIRNYKLSENVQFASSLTSLAIGIVNYYIIARFRVHILFAAAQLVTIIPSMIYCLKYKRINTFSVFYFGLQIPLLDYYIFRTGLLRVLLLTYSPPDYPLYLGTQYCMVTFSALMALTSYYFQTIRELRVSAT